MKYIPSIPYLHEPKLGRKRVLARKLALQYERLACGVFSDELMAAAEKTEADIEFNGHKDQSNGEYLIEIGGKDLIKFLGEVGSNDMMELANKALYYAWLSKSNKIRYTRFSKLKRENNHMNTIVGKVLGSRLAV